jgi:hypothetical protein
MIFERWGLLGRPRNAIFESTAFPRGKGYLSVAGRKKSVLCAIVCADQSSVYVALPL